MESIISNNIDLEMRVFFHGNYFSLSPSIEVVDFLYKIIC